MFKILKKLTPTAIATPLVKKEMEHEREIVAFLYYYLRLFSPLVSSTDKDKKEIKSRKLKSYSSASKAVSVGFGGLVSVFGVFASSLVGNLDAVSISLWVFVGGLTGMYVFASLVSDVDMEYAKNRISSYFQEISEIDDLKKRHFFIDAFMCALQKYDKYLETDIELILKSFPDKEESGRGKSHCETTLKSRLELLKKGKDIQVFFDLLKECEEEIVERAKKELCDSINENTENTKANTKWDTSSIRQI